MKKVKIVLDTERCTGHGRCYSLAGDLFDCDDRGYGMVIHPEVPSSLGEQARTAAANCPESAITLSDCVNPAVENGIVARAPVV